MALDSTYAYAEGRNLWLYFQSLHTPSAKVRFKAFITGLTQEFSSNWNSQNVFGRMDPIQTFQNTQRTINLSWKTTSFDLNEGIENLEKINKLTRMLYPTYEDAGEWREEEVYGILEDGQGPSKTTVARKSNINALTIAKPPLMRIRFVNMMRNDKGDGLIGAISGFTYEPDFEEEGVFDMVDNIVPKTINISCTITVLHEEDVGWTQTGQWAGGASFPFGLKTSQDEATTPSAPSSANQAEVSKSAANATILDNANVVSEESTGED